MDTLASLMYQNSKVLPQSWRLENLSKYRKKNNKICVILYNWTETVNELRIPLADTMHATINIYEISDLNLYQLGLL